MDKEIYVEPYNTDVVLSYLRDMYEIQEDVLKKDPKELDMTAQEYKDAWEDLTVIELVLKDNNAL